MMREYPKWRNFLLGQLARREAAIDYLHITLEEYQVDNNTPFFLKEIQTVIEAQGGVEKVAKRTAMSPETLLQILSSEEAPHFDTFLIILKALGCRLSIEPLVEEAAQPDIELAIDTESPQLSNEEPQLSESD